MTTCTELTLSAGLYTLIGLSVAWLGLCIVVAFKALGEDAAKLFISHMGGRDRRL